MCRDKKAKTLNTAQHKRIEQRQAFHKNWNIFISDVANKYATNDATEIDNNMNALQSKKQKAKKNKRKPQQKMWQ